MKRIDDIDLSLFKKPTEIIKDLQTISKSGLFKSEIVKGIESAIVIIYAYSQAESEDL